MSCGTIPKWFLEEDQLQFSLTSFLLLWFWIIVAFVGLIIQLAIFIKQTHLQSHQSVAECFATCKISDAHLQEIHVYSRKLWRFRRNIVSPFGSFLSFLVSLIYYLILLYNYIKGNNSELLIFSVHVIYFFSFNIIESLCSPNLLESLINAIPWLRYEYHNVIVWEQIIWDVIGVLHNVISDFSFMNAFVNIQLMLYSLIDVWCIDV